MTDIGEELRLCPVGGLGAILLQGIFLGEIDELLLLLLQLAAREPQLGDACPELLLALGEALLALLQHGDVGADADIATVAGPTLVDMQPAAVLDLRLVGAAVVVIGAGDRHALGDDRFGRCGDHLVIRTAGAHRVVGQAVELLIFAVAHDEAVVAVPQHEGFGDRLHGVAKSRILVSGAWSEVLLGNHGDAGQARLAIRKGPRDMPAQSQSNKVAVGVAQPEAAVEHRRALAETPVDLAPQIVVGMQSL